MKPSNFLTHPFNSLFHKDEYETIARNIMAILRRTGDVFRELSFEEYKTERLKDGNFSNNEEHYFKKVAYLAKGDEDEIRHFSESWNAAFKKINITS